MSSSSSHLIPRKPNRQYMAKEQQEFFRRLDRGGTIRVVTAEFGFVDRIRVTGGGMRPLSQLPQV
jgi:hypothetical protein